MHSALRAAVTALALASLPAFAGAQTSDSVLTGELRRSTDAFRACAAAIPKTAGHLTVMHLVGRPANHGDSLPKATHPSVDLMVETIGVYARARLGASPGNLPYADSTQDRGMATLMFSSHLHVVGRRDGTMRWWGESDSTPSGIAPVDSMRRLGERLLGASLDSAVRAGEIFVWPDAYEKADSIAFAVDFVHPLPDATGKLQPMRVRHAAPLIAVHVASNEPVLPLSGPQPSFPRRALERGATGTIVMRFVVDTTGRVIPSTIADVGPAGTRRPRGNDGRVYQDFVRAVTDGLKRARYTPARFGGCAYPSLAQQAFVFDIAP